jgi:sugar phosphate permease
MQGDESVKVKVFYGWYMVIAGLVLACYFGSIISYGWTAFVTPIIATFGWSMAQVSLASSLRSLEIGVFNPLWGPVVDRWNPKWLMIIGVVCTALGFFCLGEMQNLAMYYIGFLLVGVGSSLVTGMLPLAVIARWFRNKIGRANGLFYMGVGLGGVAVPLVVTIIDRLGWRTTLLYAAIGFLILGTSLAFVFRTRPQDYGLLPDGEAPDTPRRETEPVPASESGVSVKEAIMTRAFWHLAVVAVFQNATMSTVMLLAMPYLTSLGMGRATASTVVSLYTLVSLFGRIPLGMLSDIFRKSYVVALSIVLQLVGLFLYWRLGGTSPFWSILLFAIPYGLGVSGAAPLRAPILTEYYGSKNFGAIYGITSIFIGIANVLSPLLAGWIYDRYNDYKIWWLSLLLLGIAAAIAIFTIPPAKKRTSPATS